MHVSGPSTCEDRHKYLMQTVWWDWKCVTVSSKTSSFIHPDFFVIRWGTHNANVQNCAEKAAKEEELQVFWVKLAGECWSGTLKDTQSEFRTLLTL